MRRVAASVLLVTLLLAGCSAPESPVVTPTPSTAEATPTPDVAPTPAATPTPDVPPTATATPTPTTPSPAPQRGPKPVELQPPCWETRRDAARAPTGDAGTYEVSQGVRRADVAAVRVGIDYARSYLARCAGGDLDEDALDALRVEIVNGSGAAPEGGLSDGAPRVRIDTAFAGWASPQEPWPAAVERTRIAARAYAQAWLTAHGCDPSQIPAWLANGFADHASFGASALSGDLAGAEFGAQLWRRAEAEGGFGQPLEALTSPTAAFFAFHLLIGHPENGAAALPRMCDLMNGIHTFHEAMGIAFGIDHPTFAIEWDVFRSSPPPFSPGAGLTMPPAPPMPECFGAVAERLEDPFPIELHPDAAGPKAEDVKLGLQRGWAFLRACLGAEQPTGWTGLVVRIVADPALTRHGNGWDIDGGHGYVNVTIDVSNRMWNEGPHEFGLDAWRRVNAAYVAANIWYDSHDCRVRDAPTPYWLTEGLRQYVSRGQAIATGDIDANAMREVAWNNAVGSGAAGHPLSNWTEPRQDVWPGDWATLAMERLAAESEDGPAALAALCASLKEGTSMSTSFALAFGQRYADVADDPAWPAMPARV